MDLVNGDGEGSINVLDVEILKASSTDGLIANTTAGCDPGRIILSADGRIVWVTARSRNQLRAFDALKLRKYGTFSISMTEVGTQPVNMAFGQGRERIITANSNRVRTAASVSWRSTSERMD